MIPTGISKPCGQGEVITARLHICGSGLGKPSTAKSRNDPRPPLSTTMRNTSSIALTMTICFKENEICASGDGWYRGHFGRGSPTHYERLLALIAELRIEYADGSIETIVTDESWHYCRSFTALSIYTAKPDYSSRWVSGNSGRHRCPRLCQRYSRSCTIWKHSR